MPYQILHNKTQPNKPPLQVTTAETFWHRFVGLMGKKNIDPNYGLVFINKTASILDAAIHMLFMNFDIAVFWLDADFIVVDKVLAKKWHLNYAPQAPAKYIVETHFDRFDDYAIGDRIEFQ